MEIFAPLKIKSATSTIIDNGIVVNGTSNFNSNVTIDNTGQITASSLATSGDVIITGSLTVGNLLNTMSFYPVKPWASCLIITSGSNIVTLTNCGYCNLTASNVTRLGTGNKAYTITFPSAHPSGINIAVISTPYTGASSSWDYTNNTDYICTTKVEGSTSLTVWCRRPGQAATVGIISGSFYVYTVPRNSWYYYC